MVQITTAYKTDTAAFGAITVIFITWIFWYLGEMEKKQMGNISYAMKSILKI